MPDAGSVSAGLDATVTVFCQNEAARIGACLSSVAAAAEGLRITVEVFVNGSTDDSAAIALRAARSTGLHAQVWRIPYGDKANAINQALYSLPQGARLHVFLDGYAVVSPQALRALSDALDHCPAAVAATGVAGNGRTMRAATEETLLHGGRLHGQLHALRPDFVERLRQAQLRLPVGLYRGDGLLGSMACHDLEATGQAWDGHRIAGAAQATYLIPQLAPWRPADIARQFRRKIRQMRGRLENAAIKSVIYSGGYAALPASADEMISTWLAAGGCPQTGLADRAFMRLALRQHARARAPTAGAMAPILVGQTDGWEVGLCLSPVVSSKQSRDGAGGARPPSV